MPLGDCNTAGAAVVRDQSQRTLVRFPRRIKRFRIRAANHNLLTSTNYTTPLTYTNFYIGTPVYATTGLGRWTGNLAAAPTNILPGPHAVPTDGTDYVSAWATLPEQYQETDFILSYGFTAPATGTGVCLSGNGDAFRGGTSANAADLSVSAWSAEAGKIFGDLRLEYEVEGAPRVGLFVGDSITAGAGDTAGATPPEADPRIGILPHERWPDLAGRAGNFCAVNLGVGSIGGGSFNAATNMQFTRAAIGTSATVPDFAVSLLGTNDLYGGFTAVTAKITATVAAIRALGIKEIYHGTLLPKGQTQFAGTITGATAVGATTVVSTIDINAGVSTVIGSADDYEVVTVTGKTGTGPWTLTVNAMTKAHASGTRIVAADEAARIRVNNWLRQLPLGLAGVLDFDQHMADSPGSATSLPNYMFADKVHPHRGGANRMGLYAAQLGRV
jgi:lysophospholipase L1-like esterase